MKRKLSKLILMFSFIFVALVCSNVTVNGATNLSKKTLYIAKYSKYQLKLNGSKGTVKWTSTNPKIASVDKTGKVSILKSGNATIKATYKKKTYSCKVVAVSLSRKNIFMSKGEVYQIKVNNGKDTTWNTTDPTVATIDKNGNIKALRGGDATILCKSNNVSLKCKIHVNKNFYTLRSSLPTKTKVDDLTVVIDSYPRSKVYLIHRQNAKQNLSKKYNKYMPEHGCSVSSLTCVLNAFTNYNEKPSYTVENIEKKVLGANSYDNNYKKKDCIKKHRMPICMYGMTKVLDDYKVPYRYVHKFNDKNAINEITNHLKTGNPIIFVASAYDRSKSSEKNKGKTNKWTTGYHTMTMLGLTEDDKVIIADTVNRNGFGDNQRIKYATVTELVHYMFSCTKEPTYNYWSGKATSGGYILINPQD